MSNPSVQRGRYWVFTEDQLDEAINAISDRCGPFNDEGIGAIWDLLDSNEFAERGMRRGGTEGESQ